MNNLENQGCCFFWQTKDFERQIWKPKDVESEQIRKPRILKDQFGKPRFLKEKNWKTKDFERQRFAKPKFLKKKIWKTKVSLGNQAFQKQIYRSKYMPRFEASFQNRGIRLLILFWLCRTPNLSAFWEKLKMDELKLHATNQCIRSMTVIKS